MKETIAGSPDTPQLQRSLKLWHLIVYGIILIVMMILRPDGILTRDQLRRFSFARLRRRHG